MQVQQTSRSTLKDVEPVHPLLCPLLEPTYPAFEVSNSNIGAGWVLECEGSEVVPFEIA
jgi:hypothetical protein